MSVLCLTIGCSSTSSQKVSTTAETNKTALTVMSYKLVSEQNDDKSHSLIYKKSSLNSIEKPIIKHNLRERIINGFITQNPPLQQLSPEQVINQMQLVKNETEKSMNNQKGAEIRIKTCDQILTSDNLYIELCSYDHKFSYDQSGEVVTSDTDRIFYIGIFIGGKLVPIIMANALDFFESYSIAKQLYLSYKTPIEMPKYAELFKGIDEHKIADSFLKHDKKIFSVGKLPSNYKKQIQDWALKRFKDPDSVLYKFDVVKPLKVSSSKTDNDNIIEFCFLTNAKNSIGGYTGYEIQKAFFINGRLDKVVENFDYNDASLYYYCSIH